ncbi:hypothetical protein QTG54_015702 [Skeletonema marinoi]|uniref:MYND-type domain-containing protein n=1 Tax=Skeletonema marinoi TaxID=267567 RepID=A0AAD8XTM3_9STRA|nr:hypothetical protein QTG54_015702 [Skeletonema marinoi]
MSDNDGADDMIMLMCASCGIAEVDEVKLKTCADCDLVKYCSDACQKDHKSQHKRACKKRAAELRDELLFKQPDSSHLGDCPICCLPMPLDLRKATFKLCCSKMMCKGCSHGNLMRELEERREPKCPFCRKPSVPPTDEESGKWIMKRIEANDPAAMTQWGRDQYAKEIIVAAELGYAEAHYRLSIFYHDVEKDGGKTKHHLEEAAIGGHPSARYTLGYHEGRNRRHDRAVKHLITAATQGDDDSINELMDEFRRGFVSKDDLAAALRAHQAAVDATKSPQREAAEELERWIAARRIKSTADMLRKSTIEKITSSRCASCGIAEVEADDITLKECATCDLVRYCSDACQKNHWPQHEEACKKRSTELRDELLFKQPESSHHGDCPICCLHMPLDVDKSTIMTCCSKIVCNGCAYADALRQVEGMLLHTCPFCREPTSDTNEEYTKEMMKRVEANDPVALCQEGGVQEEKGNYLRAFEYFTKAAELGDVEAHFELSHMYRDGHDVEKDEGKEMYHLELAAIGGHPGARYNLGIGEWNNGKTERAVKHWIIAATQGDDDSINELMAVFREEDGMVSKDDLAAALRAHQAAVDSAKSPQREAAETASKSAEEYLRNAAKSLQREAAEESQRRMKMKSV